MRVGSPRRQPIRYYAGNAYSGASSAAPRTVVPSQAKAGDILIAAIAWAGTQTMDATPAGWTLILDTPYNASGASFQTYWKVLQDGARSETWTLSGSVAWEAQVTAFRHIDQVAPITTTSVESENVASSTTVTFPAITTVEKSIIVTAIATIGTRNFTVIHNDFLPAYPWGNGKVNVCYSRAAMPPGALGTWANTISAASAQGIQTIALKVVS